MGFLLNLTDLPAAAQGFSSKNCTTRVCYTRSGSDLKYYIAMLAYDMYLLCHIGHMVNVSDTLLMCGLIEALYALRSHQVKPPIL